MRRMILSAAIGAALLGGLLTHAAIAQEVQYGPGHGYAITPAPSDSAPSVNSSDSPAPPTQVQAGEGHTFAIYDRTDTGEHPSQTAPQLSVQNGRGHGYAIYGQMHQ